ncbi:hypothetical protein [Methylobacterium brachiatum]|uniref:hypothetical protein n=1 Tax=Methylobacterium brachiatum TaxID=269660 RepID=UPI0013CF36AC|nr:hypothetical protein [Methylobacterium brachiatum]
MTAQSNAFPSVVEPGNCKVIHVSCTRRDCHVDESSTSRSGEGCTKVQIETFERIATGDDQGHAPAALAALERRGLITLREMLLPGDPAVRVKVPVVPLPVHFAWCAWCAEQPGPD